ncbi:NAD(P)H-hydrate epimerase [Elizabethkingia argenteiflava]|uniref:NAD(P)H-hydrate epimerase n=1 Tax=Elizabethkingia argenteiflava TaxID=2681556 RepID=UPI001FCE590D|nr:NAD(P)H-hydrate epimerase [Elizabethkingia argenteiflava]
MKILSSSQIKTLDEKSLSIQNISSWQLMERASMAATEAILDRIKGANPSFCVFCGKGNNGGDGLAVARILHQKKYSVKVFILEAGSYSPEHTENQKRLKPRGIFPTFFTEESKLSITSGMIIIDAIFGQGLHTCLSSKWKALFQQIEASSPLSIFAIDLPSGFHPDRPMHKDTPCLKVDHVFTFEMPKLGLLMPSSEAYLKDFSIIKIGLDEKFQENLSSPYYFVEKERVKKFLKKGFKIFS